MKYISLRFDHILTAYYNGMYMVNIKNLQLNTKSTVPLNGVSKNILVFMKSLIHIQEVSQLVMYVCM